jgi:putative DNA-invertase from lambdoid prophage Rac
MRVALYCRVSSDEQTEQNQVPILEEWARRRGDEIIQIYRDTGSAWQKSDQKYLNIMIDDAHRRLFEAVLVWDLDRLTRGGIARFFNIADTLRRYEVKIMSYRQPWTDTPSELQPLLFSVFAFFAEQESRKISERTKAGMERAKAQGIHIGRPSGAKDVRRRKKTGYYLKGQKRDGIN